MVTATTATNQTWGGGKEYEQNHNTIEPAPLGIEPNMICIETQQTGGVYVAIGGVSM